MNAKKNENGVRILCIGAHPDDCDIKTGGFAIKHRNLGHKVKFISLANGDAGHHRMDREATAQRRRKETKDVSEMTGIEYEVFDNPDGRLQPSLENRFKVIRKIRDFRPDLVLTHRPNDYHPDHRYGSMLVQDSLYLVTVPHVCPDTPFLDYNPAAAYMYDDFQKPNPFDPDFVIGIDDVIETYFDILDCHESQFYEWLPYNKGDIDQVPKKGEDRQEWLVDRWGKPKEKIAKDYKERLIGDLEEDEQQVEYAEAYEICEYGSELDVDLRESLFDSVK